MSVNDPKEAFKLMLDAIDSVVSWSERDGVNNSFISKLEDAKATWMRLEVEWTENRAKVLNPFRDLPMIEE